MWGCDTRERTNPLDPRNPASQGNPESPLLYSTHDSVYVSWSHLNFSDAHNFNIYRKIEGEGDFRLIATLQPHLFSYWDLPCEYEKTRWYKISVGAENYESEQSDPVETRPGPTYLWATDRFNSTVTKYSHDGRHTVLRSGMFTEPYRITTNPSNRSILVTDLWDGRIKILSEKGTLLNDNMQLIGLTDFAFDSLDDVVWATSYNFNTCARFSFSGLKELEKSIFNSPWYIALHTEANRVFVINDGQGEIIRMDYEGQAEFQKSGFEDFRAMAYDQERDRLWVSDLNRITILENTLDDMRVLKRMTGFSRIDIIEIDAANGDVWCIDYSDQVNESRVVKFTMDGDEYFALQGFTDPRDLAVNPYNHHCFVAESSTGRLIELDDNNGSHVAENQTKGNIAKIVVQWDR